MRKFRFNLDDGTKLTIHPPTVRQYYEKYLPAEYNKETCSTIAEIISRNDEGVTFTAEDIIDKFTVDDFSLFVEKFPEWIIKERESDPNLIVPYYPTDSESKAYFQCVSGFKKIAADYCRCSLQDVYSMDLFEYWSILHDAVVWNRSTTKEGREYLENAYMYMQEKPDREAARKIFGGKNGRKKNKRN